MAYEFLKWDVADHVATITLNRPEKLNALSAGLREDIYSACDQAMSDDAIRVVLITGEGRGFCSGADLTGGGKGSDRPPSQNDRLDDHGWVGKLSSTVYELNKPTIAVINGVAAGAGMSVSLACDMRIGSSRSRFKTVFAERALSPDTGMSYFLPRIIGYSRAVDLFFTSRAIDGDEAYRMGLLDRFVEPGEEMACAQEVAAQIASLPPMALRSGKRVFQGNQDLDFHRALRNEMFGLSFAAKSPEDNKEQRASFLEKRPPKFTGN